MYQNGNFIQRCGSVSSSWKSIQRPATRSRPKTKDKMFLCFIVPKSIQLFNIFPVAAHQPIPVNIRNLRRPDVSLIPFTHYKPATNLLRKFVVCNFFREFVGVTNKIFLSVSILHAYLIHSHDVRPHPTHCTIEAAQLRHAAIPPQSFSAGKGIARMCQKMSQG